LSPIKELYCVMGIDLGPLGAAVRQARTGRGWTLKGLAERSGLSERFLSDLERGRGNISIARLAEVARTLGVPVAELVAALDAAAPARPGMITLVGLRGAGKSTLGAALAGRLGRPFVELDQEVEALAGLPLSQIFEIHGETYYRRLEREAIERLLTEAEPGVVAAGGGVVTHPESWTLLKRFTRTVWLRARPEQHYRRVMAQGDLRPMRNRPAAMAELRSLLAARERFYAEASATVDTSSLDVAAAVEALAALASPPPAGS
jgi:XRE family aerobic/anaerobic benzoate catabolism transcriptional regulator